MAQERKNDNVDQGVTLGEWLIQRPKIGLASGAGSLLIASILGKCESDRRQKDCLPTSSCHRQLWEQTNPGEKYPWHRIQLPLGFHL